MALMRRSLISLPPSRALRWLREACPRRRDTATAPDGPYAAFGPAAAARHCLVDRTFHRPSSPANKSCSTVPGPAPAVRAGSLPRASSVKYSRPLIGCQPPLDKANRPPPPARLPIPPSLSPFTVICVACARSAAVLAARYPLPSISVVTCSSGTNQGRPVAAATDWGIAVA